jgi:hypothetical protein
MDGPPSLSPSPSDVRSCHSRSYKAASSCLAFGACSAASRRATRLRPFRLASRCLGSPHRQMQSSLHRAAAHTPGNCKVLVKIDVEGGEVRVLNGLGNVEHFSSFAALLKILHLVPAYIRWLLENFDVELLDPRESALVRVEPPTNEYLEFLVHSYGMATFTRTMRSCGQRQSKGQTERCPALNELSKRFGHAGVAVCMLCIPSRRSSI